MADKTVAFDEKRVSVLTDQERSMSGFTHKFVINASDINDSTWTSAGDDVIVELYDTDADWFVEKAAVNVTTAFTASSSLAIEVGTDGDTDNFIQAASVKTAGPIIGDQSGIVKTVAGSYAAASDKLVAYFTCDSNGAPVNISTGQAVVFLTIRELNKYHRGE
jgi:hypothetical protein